MMKDKIDWRIVIVGMLCITALTVAALFMGYNGFLLTTVIALIAGTIGVTMPQLKLRN